MSWNQLRSRRFWIVMLLSGALASLVASAGFVAAQAATPTPSTKAGICSSLGETKAGPLSDLLSALVNEGIITQDQANRIQQYVTDRARTRCYQAHVLSPADILSTTATKLGLTVSQLEAELRQGKTLAQIAGEHGVTRDDLKAALLETAQANAKTLVQQGVLTQDEADQALRAVESNLDTLIDAAGPWGFKHGAGWGRGRHHHWGWQYAPGAPEQQGQNGARFAPWMPIYSQ